MNKMIIFHIVSRSFVRSFAPKQQQLEFDDYDYDDAGCYFNQNT